jgi:MarR family transcriptional regulator for hemolysin
MKKPLIEELDNVLPHQVSRLGRLLRFYIQQKLDKHESHLTPEQYFIIYRLYYKDGQTQRELADTSLRDHPNITRILDKLEGKGFLQREDDVNDRRTFIIKLSAKGRKSFEEVIPLIKAEQKKLLKGISKEEIKNIQSILSRIEANMEI